MEIRYQIIVKLTESLKSNYMLDQPMHEPDPAILEFNTDLIRFDEDLVTHFPDKEHKSVLTVFFSHH